MHLVKPHIPEKLYAVIGYPLDQSLSPLIHNFGFQSLDLAASYIKCPIAPSALDKFVAALKLLPFGGVSVTIPHKQTIIPYVDSLTPAAQKIGAVNTLFWEETKLVGDNTDFQGFLEPIKDLDLKDLHVLLLGAGGAARAAVAALNLKAAKIYLTTPSNQRHLALAQEFAATPILWEERTKVKVDLVINATPLGMHGTLAHENPYDFREIADTPKIAYDIVYNPLETLFLKAAKETGVKTIQGLAMFLGQANAQFKIWTGENLPKKTACLLKEALKSK